MKKIRFTEGQIIAILKEGETGMKVPDICRKHGISNATYYNWKSKYHGMEVSDVQRMKQLEEENRRLKNLVADQALNIQVLESVLKKY